MTLLADKFAGKIFVKTPSNFVGGYLTPVKQYKTGESVIPFIRGMYEDYYPSIIKIPDLYAGVNPAANDWWYGSVGQGDYTYRANRYYDIQNNSKTITWAFTVYMDLLSMALAGIDEFEYAITEGTTMSVNYFGSSSPGQVDIDIRGFNNKMNKKVREVDELEDVVKSTGSIYDYLSDSIISGISSGIITESNKKQYYDKISYFSIQSGPAASNKNVMSLSTNRYSSDGIASHGEVSTIAMSSFNDSGIDPATLGLVTFPATGIRYKANGITDAYTNPCGWNIPLWGSPAANLSNTFYELYDNFVKISEKLEQFTEETGRIQFTPVVLSLSKLGAGSQSSIWNDGIDDIIGTTRYTLELKFKSNGVTVYQKNIPFDNMSVFEKAIKVSAAGNPGVTIQTPAAADWITWENPSQTKLRTSLSQHIPQFKNVRRSLLANLTIVGRRSGASWGHTVFNPQSTQSRSYRFVNYETDSPTARTVCNICNIAVPGKITVPSTENVETQPRISVNKLDSNQVNISLGSCPESVDLIKFFVRPVGMEKNEFVGSITAPGTLTISGVWYPNSTYVISAKFYEKGCVLALAAQTVYTHKSVNDLQTRVSFIITGATADSTAGTHSFTIVENLESNVASEFLAQVNDSGQASVYSEEAAGEKVEIGVLTSYNIASANGALGTTTTLSSGVEAGDYSFPVETSELLDNILYEVELNAVETAASSYSTIVEEVDPTSGKSYAYRYRQWRGTDTQADESLPSTTRVLTAGIGSSLTAAGTSTQRQVVSLSSRSEELELRALSVTRDIFNECNWLKWRCEGPTSSVDHFLILAKYNGVTAPIATASVRKSGAFYYLQDRRMFDLLGTVTYTIIPVTTELKYRTDKSKQAPIKQTSLIPTDILYSGK